jgi:hypothetical protein
MVHVVSASEAATSARPKAMLAHGLRTKGLAYRNGPSTSQYDSRETANVAISSIPLTNGVCGSPKYSATMTMIGQCHR